MWFYGIIHKKGAPFSFLITEKGFPIGFYG